VIETDFTASGPEFLRIDCIDMLAFGLGTKESLEGHDSVFLTFNLTCESLQPRGPSVLNDQGGSVVIPRRIICVDDLVICSDGISKGFGFRKVIRGTVDLCSTLRAV
jgi:hypothetical protein